MGKSQGILRLLEACSDWPSIYSKLRDINNANPKLAGTLFEEFTKLYFLSEPNAQAKFKNVWLLPEVPHSIRQSLDIGKKDYGIDLVLQSSQGQLFAVQCKFRNEQSSRLGWTKDSLSSWLSGSLHADGRIIFTNASGIDTETERVARRKKFHLYTIGDLLSIDQTLISAMLKTVKDGKRAKRKLCEPRPHQKSAIEAVIAGFRTQPRGQLILPCGAGKTLTALWIKERLQAKRTLVVVPSLSLLKQLKDEWLTNEKVHKPYLCVCSDSTVDDMRKSDYAELNSFEVDENVTTSPDEIRKHLKRHKESVIYSTYQSLDAIKSAIKGQNISFDLIICDEAHRTAGPKTDQFGSIHDDSNIPGLRRLYMTATPRILSPQAKAKLNPEHLDLLADMSDPKVYGPEFFRMTFKEAIDRGILVDYKIIAVVVTDKELQKKLSDRAFVDSNTTLDDIANNLAADKAMRKFKITHALTFHSRVSGAKAFIERQKNLFKSNLHVDFVSGEQPTNERKIKLDSFARAPKALLANARCLTEGVDVPDIDCVYFCDPRNSVVDIVQATGRALRKPRAGKKKELGYIVVPTFLAEGETEDDQIDETAFGNLISVVRAMASQDQRLADEIKEIRLSKGKRKKIPSRIVVDLDESKSLGTAFSMAALEAAISYSVLSKIPIPWRNFEEARTFSRGLGLKNKDEWRLYCKGEMAPVGQVSKPEDIPSAPNYLYKDSGWNGWGDWLGTDRVILPWDVQYQHLRTFIATFKRWPNQREEYPKGNNLGWWMGTQRSKYRLQMEGKISNKNGTLSKEQINTLNDLGFPWDPMEEKWQEQFNYLKDFFSKYGREPRAREEYPKGNNLAAWCGLQRRVFHKKDPGNLNSRKVQLLRDIGFRFAFLNPEEIWLANFEKLKRFRTTFNRWPKRLSRSDEESALATWCSQQRRKMNGNDPKVKPLSKLQMRLLNEIEFPGDVATATWDTQYNFLKDFVEIRGRLPFASEEHPKGNKIGRWCSQQKARLAKGRSSGHRALTPKQKAQLNSLKLIDSTLDHRWHEQYKNVKAFQSKFHRLPQAREEFPKGNRLGDWIGTQKRKIRGQNPKKFGSLTQQQRKLLQEIGVV